MLFIDMIDIIYLIIGIIIGAAFVAGLATRTCENCERGDDCEE